MKDKTIAVIGLGLIGGSVARKLKKEGYTVLGVDINEQTCRQAEETGAVSKSYAGPKEAIAQADITILSVYPQAALEFVKTYSSDFKNDSILTDVVGIKTPLMELCESVEGGFTYIGAHPMAGKEVCGFEHSTENLFQGANFIITPSKKANDKQIKCISDLAKSLGCGHIVYTTPQKHDEIIAYTSQLPHIIAVAMCDTPLLLKHKNFTGGSFEDVTRVAKINEHLWSQLFLQNKDNILDIIDGFEASIHKIREALCNNDEAELKQIFTKVRKDKELIENESHQG